MNYRTYEPSGEIRDERLGVVLFNHIGSTVNQDTGRDAQALADDLGLKVIAANRPGTGWQRPSRLRRRTIAAAYSDEMLGLELCLKNEIERRGLERLIAAGRSAAGLGALAIAATQRLPITGVYFVETPGWYEAFPREGKTRYSAYKKEQKKRLASNSELIHPDPTDTRGLTKLQRNLGIPLLQAIDTYHHTKAWASPIALGYARYIAANLLDVEMVGEFAQESLVASPEIIYWASEELPALRDQYAEPVTINQVPYTVHSSFDLRSLFAVRMQPLVDRTLAR